MERIAELLPKALADHVVASFEDGSNPTPEIATAEHSEPRSTTEMKAREASAFARLDGQPTPDTSAENTERVPRDMSLDAKAEESSSPELLPSILKNPTSQDSSADHSLANSPKQVSFDSSCPSVSSSPDTIPSSPYPEEEIPPEDGIDREQIPLSEAPPDAIIQYGEDGVTPVGFLGDGVYIWPKGDDPQQPLPPGFFTVDWAMDDSPIVIDVQGLSDGLLPDEEKARILASKKAARLLVHEEVMKKAREYPDRVTYLENGKIQVTRPPRGFGYCHTSDLKLNEGMMISSSIRGRIGTNPKVFLSWLQRQTPENRARALAVYGMWGTFRLLGVRPDELESETT